MLLALRRMVPCSVLLFAFLACSRERQPRPWFVERTAELGLDFTYENGRTGELHLPEIMGGGAALIDFDRDGDLDVYLVQGGRLDGSKTASEDDLTDRLYRNDLVETSDGSTTLRFVDVTERAGLAPGAFGMGVAAGDYDGDGWMDLYVTAFGANRLLRNSGDGTLEDATTGAGVEEERWSVAATFFDADADGHLDLYVGNYLDYRLAAAKTCRDSAGRRDYCGPDAYLGVSDRLFRNLGNGSFEDASLASGVGLPRGKSLGAVAEDLDGDGRIDLYVGNDGEPNFLWRNLGDGRFAEVGLSSGSAVSGSGLPQASMGIDAADYDADGDPDLLLTHLDGEPNTLYRNDSGTFFDVSTASGVGPPSWPFTGFGARLADLDGDGWLDLFVANGAVRGIQELMDRGDPFPLHQKNLLFRSENGHFELIPTAMVRSEVSRGAAFGDVDNDGDLDIVVVNNGGPARLLMNQSEPRRNWFALEVIDAGSGSALHGSRVRATLPDGRRLDRRRAGGGSYASSSDPRPLLALGATEPPPIRLEIPQRPDRLFVGLRPGFRHRTTAGTG